MKTITKKHLTLIKGKGIKSKSFIAPYPSDPSIKFTSDSWFDMFRRTFITIVK